MKSRELFLILHPDKVRNAASPSTFVRVREAQEWFCLKDNERKIQNAIQHVRDGRTLTVRTGTYAPPPEGDPPVYEEPRPLFFDDVNYRTQR